MPRKPPYPREVRERAVRMVFEHRHEYDSQWAAITLIAEKFGMTAETLRSWVRQPARRCHPEDRVLRSQRSTS